MVLCPARPAGYTLGCALLPACLLCLAMALTSPDWLQVVLTRDVPGSLHLNQTVEMELHFGVLQSCAVSSRSGEASSCWMGYQPLEYISTNFSGSNWLMSVSALQTICLVGLVACCTYTLVINCVLKCPRHTRFLEVTGGVFSVTGLTSTALYAVKVLTLEKLVTAAHEEVETNVVSVRSFCWPFYLSTSACLAFLLSSLIIARFNKPATQQLSQGQKVPEDKHASRRAYEVFKTRLFWYSGSGYEAFGNEKVKQASELAERVRDLNGKLDVETDSCSAVSGDKVV